jgi:hypothetical protein
MLAQIDSRFIWVPLKFHAEAFMTDDSGILAVVSAEAKNGTIEG